MPLLNDQELVDLVLTKKIIEGLPDPPSLPNATAIEAWYGRDSAIQPSSIDLHIGDILVPNVTADAPGSVAKPKKDFTLQLGQMVVITSLEQLNLPDNIAAFGFPPARLSSRGLLMTNPGHVDPGFRGGLSFTVMNIGKADISLRKHDPIVTLLFFELKSAAKAGYATRYKLKPLSPGENTGEKATPAGPTQDQVNDLSRDFLDVSTRADSAAANAVANAEFRVKRIGAWVSGIGVLVALLVAIFGIWQPIKEVRTDLENVKNLLQIKENKSRLDKVDEIENLKQQIIKLENRLTGETVKAPGGQK